MSTQPDQVQDTPRTPGRAMLAYRSRAAGRSVNNNHSRAVGRVISLNHSRAVASAARG